VLARDDSFRRRAHVRGHREQGFVAVFDEEGRHFLPAAEPALRATPSASEEGIEMGARAAAEPALSDPEPVEGESNGRSASNQGERDASSNPALRINQKRKDRAPGSVVSETGEWKRRATRPWKGWRSENPNCYYIAGAGEGETAPFPCDPIPEPKNKHWSFTQ
jgi:hypothetical protein